MGHYASGVTVGTSVFTGGTTGSVLFVGAGSVVQQNNANFFWDNTKNGLRLNASSSGTLAALTINPNLVADNSAIVQVNAINITDKPLVLQGASGQTADLQEWQNNAGTVLAKIDHLGALSVGSLSIGGTTPTYDISALAGSAIRFYGQASPYALIMRRTVSIGTTAEMATTDVPLTVQGVGSQTGNLTEWKNSSGTVFAFIGPDTLSGSSATSNYLNITGTFPTTLAAQVNGVLFSFTGAGSSAQNVVAFKNALVGGFTGSSVTAALLNSNTTAGTGTTYINGGGANYGLYNTMISTTVGTNVGELNYASGGNQNFGSFNQSTTAKNSATNIGVIGFGLNTGSSPIELGGYFGLHSSAPTYASAALMCDNGTEAVDIFVARDNGTAKFSIIDGGSVSMTQKISTYNNVATAGWGTLAIYGTGRSTAQTAAVTTVSTYTVGAADGSFIITANVNVTTSTAHSFTVTCTYTDETNTSRTLTLSFIQIGGGTPIATITNVTGAGPYEGVPNHIRCKASTAITIATTGTFTTVTYNVEGTIIQIS